MKKIINGKKYDTETATYLGRYQSPGNGWSDFSYYEETLYRKKTGEFFLHGEGGPMTRYARSESGNTRTGGETIIPLTIDEAKAWAEEKLEADKYEEIFGEVEE